MKEYEIEICEDDFFGIPTYIKGDFVKIRMTEEEKKDFYKRYENGEDIYVVFTCKDKKVRYRIKEHIPFLTLAYKDSVVVSLIR